MCAMPSKDTDPHPPLSRRGFVALATRAVLWMVGGAAAVGLGRYLSYSPSTARPTRFTLDVPEAYPSGARVVVPGAGAAVYRDAEGFFARSLTCGHLGCRVRPSQDGGFACPCHGSRFAAEGARLQGPAPRDLEGLALALDDRGRLVVDLSARVDSAWRLASTPPIQASTPRKGICRT
jgi:cytochrome b6-f complex iron-sulfur subunit